MTQLQKPGLFVTGTDTGVGKTVVTAALAGALRRRGVDVGVMKPVESGAIDGPHDLIASDARFLAQVAGVDDPAELVCPFLLKAPLAPVTAAELEGRTIVLAEILAAFRSLQQRHSLLLVEGAGGLMAPLTRSLLVRDLAREMGLPVLVVARPHLGTINHTLLTLEAARRAGLMIVGVVLSKYPAEPGLAEQTSPELIESLSNVPVLARFPEVPGVDTEAGEAGAIVRACEECGLLDRVLELLPGQ